MTSGLENNYAIEKEDNNSKEWGGSEERPTTNCQNYPVFGYTNEDKM